MKKRHPEAVREWALQQIMLPIGRSMSEVACELGVTTETLRLWRKAFLSQLDSNDDASEHSALSMNARQGPAPRSWLVAANPGKTVTLPRFGNGRWRK